MSKLLHKAVRQKSENAFSIYQQHLANRPANVSADFMFYIVLFGLGQSDNQLFFLII